MKKAYAIGNTWFLTYFNKFALIQYSWLFLLNTKISIILVFINMYLLMKFY